VKRAPKTDGAIEEDEISELLETLHRTGARLEELTGGEIDSVADRGGRTFLLRGVQEELRRVDASRQALILDGLPPHIALLDAGGAIEMVNESWRRFGRDNALHHPGNGIGVNYLDICDRAQGTGAEDAQAVAMGIRSVLGGRATSFTMEYPCHSPRQQRWFALTVTPLAEGRSGGAVVMHVNITERKRNEAEILSFGEAMDASSDGIYLVDRASMCFLHVNDTACRMQGMSRDELLARAPGDGLFTPRAELERIYDAIIESGTVAEPVEVLTKGPGGMPVWLELRRQAQRARDGWTIVTVARDVTERKQTALRLVRLNRVYAVLSRINALIVRVRNREELFEDSCRIAVEHGALSIAWIGLVNPDGTQLVPIAQSGADASFIPSIRDGYPLGEDANTMSAHALRDKAPVVSNDIRIGPAFRHSAVRIQQGIRSIAVLPLVVSGVAAGVLALYSTEVNFFDAEEMVLLTELAGDIAHAMDHIDKQDRLDYLAYYDPLTELANRSLFMERLAQHMRGAETNGHSLALFMVDIARFKGINDSLGRAAGDELLRQMAAWMARNTGDASLLARLGADHFAVMLPKVNPTGSVVHLLEGTMRALLAHPFHLQDAVFRIDVRVGAAIYPEDGPDADGLLRNAEAALKQAKARGDRFLFFHKDMGGTATDKLTIENQLRQALEKEEFVLHYQPKLELLGGRITGVEALIRWNDPRTGLVPPARFIPILEETGLIHDVGRWAMQQAIGDYQRWKAAGLRAVRVAVNVSPLQMRQDSFVEEISQAFDRHPLARDGLELEITEGVLMQNVRNSITTLQAVRATGTTIAIDDFGTGFSSLSYLSKLPVDTLKIDRSFVVEMTETPAGLALVATIINLAHALRLTAVAEGVETEEQARLLRLLKCDEMQGFLRARPMPVAELEAKWLTAPALA